MSRTDAMRWRDWEKVRDIRRCAECGQKFMPDIPRQRLCRRCAGQEADRERAPVSADQAEHEKLLRLLDRALADDAQHRPIALAEPPSDRERLRRRADQTVAALGGNVPTKPSRKGRRHSVPPQWAPVARAKIADGWPLRKIAKLLDVTPDDVRLWGIVTAEELRFRAAADGKLKAAHDDEPERSGNLPWCRAKQRSTCRLCSVGMFPGDKMARVDEHWVHATCAEQLGYTIIDRDRRSPARKKAEARMARRP